MLHAKVIRFLAHWLSVLAILLWQSGYSGFLASMGCFASSLGI